MSASGTIISQLRNELHKTKTELIAANQTIIKLRAELKQADEFNRILSRKFSKQAIENEEQFQQHQMVLKTLMRCSHGPKIDCLMAMSNIDLDFQKHQFELLNTKYAVSKIFSNVYDKHHVGVKNYGCMHGSASFEAGNKTDVKTENLHNVCTEKYEKTVNLTIEVNFRQIQCADETHIGKDKKHIGPIHEKCELIECLGVGSGLLLSTRPYMVILSAAHLFAQKYCHSFCVKWCPYGKEVYQMSLKWVKVHRQYHIDPKRNDLALAVGVPENIPSEILKRIASIPIQPFQLNFGDVSAYTKGYYLEGFSSAARKDKQALMYRSDATIIHHQSGWIRFKGAIIMGLSGGGLWVKKNADNAGANMVIAIQSSAYHQKNAAAQTNFEIGEACGLTPSKIRFLCKFAPCAMMAYKIKNTYFLSVCNH